MIRMIKSENWKIFVMEEKYHNVDKNNFKKALNELLNLDGTVIFHRTAGK